MNFAHNLNIILYEYKKSELAEIFKVSMEIMLSVNERVGNRLRVSKW